MSFGQKKERCVLVEMQKSLLMSPVDLQSRKQGSLTHNISLRCNVTVLLSAVARLLAHKQNTADKIVGVTCVAMCCCFLQIKIWSLDRPKKPDSVMANNRDCFPHLRPSLNDLNNLKVVFKWQISALVWGEGLFFFCAAWQLAVFRH